MKNNLPTEAGQTNQKLRQENGLIDAINQVFALFKLNYHNQFFKAFSQATDLNSTKRLWLESLNQFPPEVLLRAAKTVMESSEFLPTLHTMLKHCEEQSAQALPDAHSAYLEACRAPSPKADFSWTHPAIYFAGKKSDWYFLQSNTENIAFPIFKQHYQELSQRVRQGEKFTLPKTKHISEESIDEADPATSKKHISSLKAMFDE